MQIDRHSFTGGLNSDDSSSVFPSVDMLELVNARPNLFGSRGSVVEFPDLVAVTMNQPQGENQFIGGVDNISKGYFFVWNSLGSHTIYEYDGTSVAAIYVNQQLKFTRDMWITGAVFGDLLYFTDGVNEPKRIDVNKARANEYTSDINEIVVIRRGPLRPLVLNKVNDPSFDSDTIGDNAYQFAYRYIYKGGEVSVLSPYSITIPRNDPSAQYTSVPYNSISIAVPSDEELPSDVEAIEFLFKDLDRPSWYVFDKQDDGTTTSYSGQGGTAIADTEANRLFDYVPVAAKSMAGMNNRIFYGNITENLADNTKPYPPTVTQDYIDVETQFTATSGTWVSFTGSVDILAFTQGGAVYGTVETHNLIEWVILSNGSYYYPNPDKNDLEESLLPASTYSFGIPYTQTEIEQKLDARLVDKGETRVAILNQAGQYTHQYNTSNDGQSTVSIAMNILGFSGSSVPSGAVLRCYAPGAQYQYAIAFYDKYGRVGKVITDDSYKVVTAKRTYGIGTNQVDNVTSSVNVQLLGVSPAIPEWAYHYNVLRSKNQTYSYLIEGIANINKYAYYNAAQELVFTDIYDSSSQFFALRVVWLNNNRRGLDPVEGDKLEVIFKNSHEGYAIKNTTLEATGVFDGEYVLFSVEDLGDLSNQTIWFTLTRPFKKETNELFYEVSPSQPIVAPGTVARRFNNFKFGIPGDCYLQQIGQTILTGNAAAGDNVVGVQTAVGLSSSTYHDTVGRALIPITKNQGNRVSTISFGQQYFPNGTINSLSTFYAFDQRDLDSDAGEIVSIVNTSKTEGSGSVMLAIGTAKTYSMYIGEAQINYSGSTAGLAITEGVIGSINELGGNIGCENPESVCAHNGLVFWVDINNLAVVQYSRAGLQDLTQTKMVNYFSKALTAADKSASRIYTGVNPQSQELMLTIEKDLTAPYVASKWGSVAQQATNTSTITRELVDNSGSDPATEEGGTNVN
jgi:hypothetical protein